MPNTKPPFLTKSRFKIGLECLSKLYFTGKKAEYKDQDQSNEFLLALADSGYQVGELAKYKFCDDPMGMGITIDTLNYEAAAQETTRRLALPGNVVIAEAAFLVSKLFVRTDILVKEEKRGKVIITIYEVKSKSIDPETDSFLANEGKEKERINGEWSSYLYDLAFQKYVVQKALEGTDVEVRACLVLVDSTKTVNVDGLNQRFRIEKGEGNRKKIVVDPALRAAHLDLSILHIEPMDEVIDKIWNQYPVPTDYAENMKFEDFVKLCTDTYVNDQWVPTGLGSKCKACQFRLFPGDAGSGLKSGMLKCWQEASANKVNETHMDRLVTELWGGSARSIVETCVGKDCYTVQEVDTEWFAGDSTSSDPRPGLLKRERLLLQIDQSKEPQPQSHFDQGLFLKEAAEWTYPLNAIDFETGMYALPFHKGTTPYQGIAFQFSHHLLHQDGKVEHKNHFIHYEQGVYPNLEFIRALKQALEENKGTIFRYHNHENTYLRLIRKQLHDGSITISDAEKVELTNFIDSITRWKEGKAKEYTYGSRAMVDLFDLVLRYYLSPVMKGSNSIKKVIPAVIQDSKFLREKYSVAGRYGKNLSLKSLNFDDHVWIREEMGRDPYKTLPPVFEGYSREELDSLVQDFEELADGGAALTAYNYLQFSDVPDDQKKQIEAALLKYCELDTLSMIMILEAWKNWSS